MIRIAGSRIVAALLLLAAPAAAQGIDMSHGGPVDVTAASGLEYDQNANTVTARGDARAVRGDVTVTADELIAHLRKKAPTPGAPAAASTPGAPAGTAAPAKAAPAVPGPADTGDNEIYRLEAIGNVHIYTPTDHVEGAEHGLYDIDQAVLVLTGPHLKLTTPQQVMTARDEMEYWSQRRMSVGRGDAVVTTNDGRRIAGDTLVGFSAPPAQPGSPGTSNTPHPPVQPVAAGTTAAKPAGPDPFEASGKLQRVEAYGHVTVRTATDTVTGNRGVYVPDTGIARLLGNVHVTRGQNQLNGAEAVVNMKTGISTLTQTPGARVEGLVVPNESGPQAGGSSGGPAGAAPAPAKAGKGARP